jgi:hypothetical protein
MAEKYGGGAESYARFKQYDYRAVSDPAPPAAAQLGSRHASVAGGSRRTFCLATTGAMQQLGSG